jgi:hypothetical protein
MVERTFPEFSKKQTQGSCIVFSYCLIMSHFLPNEPHEIMVKFINDFNNAVNRPSNLANAELSLMRNCYLQRAINIDNNFIKNYHLQIYPDSGINIELLSLNKQEDVDRISQILHDNDALLSASYTMCLPNNWHCTPIGKDDDGFYLIQTNRNMESPLSLDSISSLIDVDYVHTLGDCLLLFKDSDQE